MMTKNQFLALPTADEWQQELREGWEGSDGSTCSTDKIFGVVIGRKSRAYHHHKLPATLHDWRYRMGRRYDLPESYRKAADEEYRDGCIAATDAALGNFFLRACAHARANTRYYALRAFGERAFRSEAKL